MRRTDGRSWKPSHRAVALMLGLLAGALAPSCIHTGRSLCGHHELRANDVPLPHGFAVLSNVTVEPFGCGDSFKRHAVLTNYRDPRAATGAYGAALRTSGWRS